MLKRNKQKPRTRKQALDDLTAGLGEELSAEEREYLHDLNSRLEAEPDLNNPATEEEMRRAIEQRRIAREFRPHRPLYAKNGDDSTGGLSKASYQQRPEYQEEVEERRRRARPADKYDDEVIPVPLEELEKSGWDGTLQPRTVVPSRPAPVKAKEPEPEEEEIPPPAPRRPAPAPQAPVQSAPPAPAEEDQQPYLLEKPKPPRRRPDYTPLPSDMLEDLQPGVILRFDDGSIAVFKDTVPGKPYSLFYFLEPSGRVSPKGIVVQQYDTLKIGQFPRSLFERLMQSGQWDRDALVFHLDNYHHVDFVRTLAGAWKAPEPQSPSSSTNVHVTPARGTMSVAPDSLVRGRILRLRFSGNLWEAIYWTRDEIGPIVAHNTSGEWCLMHLDLSRFKDSLEYHEILTEEMLAEIEASLAASGR